MLIFDRIDLARTKRKITDEGYLSVPASIARIGIQEYNAADIGMADVLAETRVKVYRPPNEVFDRDSISSFALKPVTNGHPPGLVSIKNIKKYQVGHAGGTIDREGDFLKTELLITDEDTIADIQEGKCEISNGYVADFDYTPGTTETGEHYDASMKNIRGNHIAIVDQARGGRGLRLSDEYKQEQNMKKIMFDGIEIEVTEQAAQAIAKLQEKVVVVTDSLASAETKIETAQAAHDAAIESKDQEIADAKSKIVGGKDLDALIEARAKVITDAKTLHKEVVTDGKSNDEIVEAVVIELCDGVDFTGKTPEYKATYCTARFEGLLSARATAGDGTDNIIIDEKKAKEGEEDAGEIARKKFSDESEEAYMLKKEKK